MHRSDENAVCRGCGLVLRGKPYYTGQPAYHPTTNERCPANYYGGFVCSYDCDRRASGEQESSMPGAGGASRFLSTGARESLERNWRRA